MINTMSKKDDLVKRELIVYRSGTLETSKGKGSSLNRN